MAQYTREMFYNQFGIYPEQYGVIIGERWAKYNGYTNDQDPKTLDVYKYINEQVDKFEGLPYYLPFKPEGNWYTEYNDFARLMQNWSRYSDYEIRKLFEETKERIALQKEQEEKRRQEEQESKGRTKKR